MTPGSHRRRNLLTGGWVLVSPHRLARPWQGAVSERTQHSANTYDPQCYLCPGNARANGAHNPAYESVYAFDNDFPALTDNDTAYDNDRLLTAEPETGVCRVLCYAPEHDLTLSRMPVSRIRSVVDAWAMQYEDLAARKGIAAITIFENRGDMMGASNPHPHGQIWATSSVPHELALECAQQRAHHRKTGTPLLLEYAARERTAKDRVVFDNGRFLVVVPFWATWPFETLIIPDRPIGALPDLSDTERDALAEALGRLTAGYDALFDAPFPYSMGWHQKPVSHSEGAEGFVAHAHFYPPLLRSATIRKFMVGFEMLGMPQRDLTPEAAAERLRAAVSR